MIFLSRSPGGPDPYGPDPYLEWKVGTFAVGAVLGLAGIALDERWLVWAALAVLAAGFVLAALSRLSGRAPDEPDEEGGDPSGGPHPGA